MMTCAPLTFPEDLKLIFKLGMAKPCPPGIVPREYGALQFCMSPGEPSTQGHYLRIGLSTLSGAHMRLRDVMLFPPYFLQESTPLVHPWHKPPFQASVAPEILETIRDHRTPREVATYLTGRFLPKP